MTLLICVYNVYKEGACIFIMAVKPAWPAVVARRYNGRKAKNCLSLCIAHDVCHRFLREISYLCGILSKSMSRGASLMAEGGMSSASLSFARGVAFRTRARGSRVMVPAIGAKLERRHRNGRNARSGRRDERGASMRKSSSSNQACHPASLSSRKADGEEMRYNDVEHHPMPDARSPVPRLLYRRAYLFMRLKWHCVK